MKNLNGLFLHELISTETSEIYKAGINDRAATRKKPLFKAHAHLQDEVILLDQVLHTAQTFFPHHYFIFQYNNAPINTVTCIKECFMTTSMNH